MGVAMAVIHRVNMVLCALVAIANTIILVLLFLLRSQRAPSPLTGHRDPTAWTAISIIAVMVANNIRLSPKTAMEMAATTPLQAHRTLANFVLWIHVSVTLGALRSSARITMS